MERFQGVLLFVVGVMSLSCGGQLERGSPSEDAASDTTSGGDVPDASSDTDEAAVDSALPVPYDGEPSRCLGRGNIVYVYAFDKTHPERDGNREYKDVHVFSAVPDDVYITNTVGAEPVKLEFGSRSLGAPLRVGSYPEAHVSLAPPAGTARLWLWVNGVACLEDFGSFDIHRLDWTTDKTPKLTRIHATFRLSCNFYDYTGCVYLEN